MARTQQQTTSRRGGTRRNTGKRNTGDTTMTTGARRLLDRARAKQARLETIAQQEEREHEAFRQLIAQLVHDEGVKRSTVANELGLSAVTVGRYAKT